MSNGIENSNWLTLGYTISSNMLSHTGIVARDAILKYTNNSNMPLTNNPLQVVTIKSSVDEWSRFANGYLQTVFGGTGIYTRVFHNRMVNGTFSNGLNNPYYLGGNAIRGSVDPNGNFSVILYPRDNSNVAQLGKDNDWYFQQFVGQYYLFGVSFRIIKRGTTHNGLGDVALYWRDSNNGNLAHYFFDRGIPVGTTLETKKWYSTWVVFNDKLPNGTAGWLLDNNISGGSIVEVSSPVFIPMGTSRPGFATSTHNMLFDYKPGNIFSDSGEYHGNYITSDGNNKFFWRYPATSIYAWQRDNNGIWSLMVNNTAHLTDSQHSGGTNAVVDRSGRVEFEPADNEDQFPVDGNGGGWRYHMFNGFMHMTGWQTISGNRKVFYSRNDGSMAKGERWIDGVYANFNVQNGALLNSPGTGPTTINDVK